MRKTAYFSLSGALILENLRRFWAISALSFLGYFFAGIFPILMNFKDLQSYRYLIQQDLSNQNFVFAFLLFAAPMAAAVVTFSYLQHTPSTSTMHALPFSRAKLFNSNMLSGLILSEAPVILTGILFHLFSKPVFDWYTDEEGVAVYLEDINYFAHEKIWIWIGVTLLVVAITYMISVFAGMVTGTVLHHAMAAIGFNFLIPVMYGACIVYSSVYLFGFNINGPCMEYVLNLCPAANAVYRENLLGTPNLVAYLITLVLLTVLCAFLYRKRHMEKATDAITFRFLKPVLCFILTFLGMTAMGFFFTSLVEIEDYARSPMLYIGFAVGTVIFWIISSMIIKKTLHVFSKKDFKWLGIYVLTAAVFLLCIGFDVPGFEKKVPPAGNITSAEFDCSIDQYGNGSAVILKDAENIKALTALHKSLTGCEDRFRANAASATYAVTFTYHRKGLDFSRTYQADYQYLLESPQLKAIMESKEYKEQSSPLAGMKGTLSLNNAELYSNETSGNYAFNVLDEREAIMNLVDLLKSDYMEMPFETMIDPARKYAFFSVEFCDKSAKSRYGDYEYRQISVNVSDQLTGFAAELDRGGWLEGMKLEAEDVTAARLYEPLPVSVCNNKSLLGLSQVPGSETEEDLGMQPLRTITDTEEIRALLNSGKDDYLDLENWYRVEFSFPQSEMYYEDSADSEVYEKQQDIESSITLYYPETDPTLGL